MAARLFCSLTAALPPFGSHSALSLSLCTRSPILPLSRDTFVHCALPRRPATPRLNWELINRAIPFDWRCLSSIESCVDVPLHWISANNRAGDYVTVFTRLSLSLSAEFALSGTCSAHSRVYFMDHNSVVPPDIYTIYILAPDLPPHAKKKQKKQRRASHRDMPSSRYKLGELRQIDTHTHIHRPQVCVSVCVCINNIQIHIVNTYLHKVK